MNKSIDKLSVFIDHFIDSNYKRGILLGYDPYDFANSKIRFKNKSLSAKLSYLNKISPINFRPILGIKQYANTKGNALLLSALIMHGFDSHKQLIDDLILWFENNRSYEFEEISWGFSSEIDISDYSSKPGETSLIISLFVIFAFIDYYSKTSDHKILQYILEFENIIANKWPKFETDDSLWYSYLSSKELEVYNATAKIGKFYAKLYKISPNSRYLVNINKILNYLFINQNNDYSWPYSKVNRYIDHYHTVFILDAINEMLEIQSNPSYQEKMYAGYNYYKTYLFENQKPIHFSRIDLSKNFRKQFIQVEIRDCANAIMLLSKFNDYVLADSVIDYTISNFYSSTKHYFYFYKNTFWASKIKYTRWQSWMLYALVFFKYRKQMNT